MLMPNCGWSCGSWLQAARDMINQQVKQMARLIDDRLDVSRITRGKPELRRERVLLSAILEQALNASRPEIVCTGHELTVLLPPGPLVLNADPVRLAQVFQSLLNNASKYSGPDNRI